jgi:hypothetical protein
MKQVSGRSDKNCHFHREKTSLIVPREFMDRPICYNNKNSEFYSFFADRRSATDSHTLVEKN